MKMTQNAYFAVQTNKKEFCGYKTYTEECEGVEYFELADERKAVALFKKRAANDIILRIVQTYDEAPYAASYSIFGEIEDWTSQGKIIRFKDKETGIDIAIPYASKSRAASNIIIPTLKQEVMIP